MPFPHPPTAPSRALVAQVAGGELAGQPAARGCKGRATMNTVLRKRDSPAAWRFGGTQRDHAVPTFGNDMGRGQLDV